MLLKLTGATRLAAVSGACVVGVQGATGQPGLSGHLTRFVAQPLVCFQPRTELAWSLISSSPALSGFSAVLAAFTFAAMVLLLTRELQEDSRGRLRAGLDPQIGRPISSMLAAFFSLIMAAFLFAAMTGEVADKANPRQFIEGALPSVVLAIGVVQMAVGVAWLLRVRDLVGVPVDLARLMVRATVVLAAFFLAGIVVSPLLQKLADPGFAVSSWIAWVALMGLIVGAIPVGAFSRGLVGRYFRQDQIIRYVNVGSMAVSVLAALGWNVLTSVSRCAVFPLYGSKGGNLIIVGSFVLAAALFAALEVATPGDNEDQPIGPMSASLRHSAESSRVRSDRGRRRKSPRDDRSE